MSIPSRFLFDLATSISNTASELGRDFQQGLDSARERGVVISPEEGTISEASAQQATDWRTEYEVPVAVAIPQSRDTDQAEVEFEPGVTPSTGRDVGNKASDGALSAIPPCPQEGRISPNDLSPADFLLRTAAELAKIDIQIAGVYLEEFNDGEVSEESQKQTADRVEEIQTMLAMGSHTHHRNNKEAIAKAHEVIKASETLAKSILRTEIGASSDPESPTNGVVESGLHAGELLTQSIRRCLQALYTALVQQLSCCDEKHFIRLKLTGFVDPMDHGSRPFFDLYLSNGHDCARSYWVESKCTFIRELTHGEEKGCSFIKTSILDKTKLSLLLKETRTQGPETENTSVVEGTQESLGPIQLDVSKEPSSSVTPIVSLASLMEQGESGYETRRLSNAETFLPKERDWLCLNLALSLLHMSSGDWRRVIWYSADPDTKTGIFFLRDPSTQKIVDKTRPYMSWRLQGESSVQKPTKGLHCDTQLLDFARLLIEIHNWKRLPNSQCGKLQPSKEQLRLQLLQYIRDNFRPVDSEFTSALKACLNDAGRIEADAEDRPERIQAYVFENIVKPLHRYLGNPELPKSTLTAMPSSDQAALDSSSQPENTTSIYDLSVNYDEPEEKSPHEKKFWANMAKFTDNYISTLQNPTLSDDVNPWRRQKVRIAVIDSGVREEDAEIVAANANEQIQGYRNFTSSDPNNCEDQIGHGTMVTRLLLTVAPEAEVYIAKISNQKIMPKNQVHRIAEAIKWAVEHWDVDIISISLALSEEHYDINEELTQALDKGKLVFAAAGNPGPYERRAWPARKKGVIAVHATDWSGTGTRTNPNPEGGLNLATLGYNIKMRWPDRNSHGELKNVYISGSSFATPIAAGIAANVLEFARQELEMNEGKKWLLYSHHGMTKILKAMSGQRGDYDFVHPLALWEEAFHGGDWRGLHLPRDNSKNIRKVLNFILA
ncbi:hypothetical protein NCS57_00950600 [Fusarium keratoplasticum]|uniref:Uncharacterized protein n=1 Tax=Fusarium keratoplasticum TaxID=1328300 RepID=A0ACC0QSC1_9HYPO|nr:hypothetical protein NCS57_00950600 [Fusarium keratoplasticum]KAI8663494.1 hypothetical protein NCS57_00950600 [Fusarium keratoplasticum]